MSSTGSKVRCAIIGGGPAGLTAALEFVIIDAPETNEAVFSGFEITLGYTHRATTTGYYAAMAKNAAFRSADKRYDWVGRSKS